MLYFALTASRSMAYYFQQQHQKTHATKQLNLLRVKESATTKKLWLKSSNYTTKLDSTSLKSEVIANFNHSRKQC
jgi:hypothetical protein